MSVFLSSGSPSRSVARRRPELADQRLQDRLLDEQPRPGAAHVALVEVDAVDDALDRLIEGAVVEDDVGGLAAQLERVRDAAAGELALDRLPDLGRAGEGDLVDPGVPHELRARRPVARDDVHGARRELGLATHVGEDERGERGRLGRLQDDGVAAGERRRHLPRQHEQREVPRDDLAGDAERPRPPVREGVLELVGPAGVVEEVRGGERQIDVARLLDRLAAVERLGDRELAASLLKDAGDAEEVLRPLGRPQLGPGAEALAGGRDGRVDVLRAGLGDLGKRLLGRRRDRREPLARPRLDISPPMERP